MDDRIYQWSVIGAGPAGITAIGKLLDKGVDANDILWISDHFNVGDFGLRWQEVSSNTKVSVFLNYLNSVESFQFDKIKNQVSISQLDMDQCCHLKYAYEPLQIISDQFYQDLATEEGKVDSIRQIEGSWQIRANDDKSFQSEKIILAQGSQAKRLKYEKEQLPLEVVLNESKLKALKANSTVAVFGSSHSAILAVKNLLTANHKVINFYLNPLRYALEMDGWTLYDNTGLKGPVAQWSRENLHNDFPLSLEESNYIRVPSNQMMVDQYLDQCDYAVYAIGFDRRLIKINHDVINHYCEHSGIIAPGVFGVGIAYPQSIQSPIGTVEGHVGLWKFSNYLDQVLPIWLSYH
ncbi:hypothetical protein L3V86_01335 [Thiotrichales bacterium 19S11-10]|nr:hypothetical protein [Thiotrichales bacterium 19S11-10]